MQPDNQAPVAGLGPPPLNPAQQRTLERLLTPPWELPVYAENLADAMRGRLERDLSASPAVMQAKKTVFSKNDLSSVLSCEDYHLVNKNTFEWSPVTARGTLTHKAIQLGAFGRLAKEGPGEWVEAAFDYFEEGWTRPTELGAWLERDCSPAQRSELEGEAVDRATKFQQTFPTLVRAWAPRFESAAKAELLGGNVVLRGKFDLALTLRHGQPGSSVIIDFKTGPVHQSHRDDLRFYALLETMRAGVPPWRVATFDLDSATFVHEDLTDEVLEAALARTVRGVTLCAELWLENREARRTPGAQCRWCELNQDCSVAWSEGRPPDDE